MHVVMRIAVEKNLKKAVFIMKSVPLKEKTLWGKIMCFNGVVFVRSRCLNKYLQLEPVGSIRGSLSQMTEKSLRKSTI